MKNAPVSLSQLLVLHPEVQRELAKLLASSKLVKARTASKMASFGELRRFGAAIFETLNFLAAEARDIAEREGMTATNAWRYHALASLSKDLYPVARDAWGIPALAPVKENVGGKKTPSDWRRHLVDVADATREEPEAPMDGREPTEPEADPGSPAAAE